MLPAVGRFIYERTGQRYSVKFNGRNLQFHALYEEHYRFGYELETALLIATLCSGNASFFDIGSNWGYFSLLAASLPEFSGDIYAFEPNPSTFADLNSTLVQAQLNSRVKSCNLGIGRTECELTVTEADPFNTGLSRLAADGIGRKIPVKPLDNLNFARPGFIKIDAEGMEQEILAGATRTLAEDKPFVVLENFLDYEDASKTYAPIQFLIEHDYHVFIPVLDFSIKGSSVLATYAWNYTALVSCNGAPRLGVVELSIQRRFLLGQQLNLLAVHVSKIQEFWNTGIKDFGKM